MESVEQVRAEVADEVFGSVTVLVVVREAVGAREDGVPADGEDDWEAALLDLVYEGADGGVA